MDLLPSGLARRRLAGRHLAGVAALALAAATPAGAQSVTSPDVHARVFGDVNYLDSQRPVPEGFRIGQVAAHVVAKFSDRVNVFSEATASPLPSGFTLEVERFILRYDRSDLLKLSAGRYHTPLGYWNTAYHHGTWLQTTVTRPEMMRQGSTLLPVHFVGAMAEGTAHVGALALGYTLGVGNGRGTAIARGGDAGDANGNRALVASGTVHLPPAAGAQFGISYYADRVTPSAAMDVRERTITAHFARERETPEVIVELALVRHEALRPVVRTTTARAHYVQLAYRLPGAAHALKPYVRVEQNRIPAADTLLAPLRLNYTGASAGVRLDLGASAAIKLEYRSERAQFGRRQGSLATQVTFTFPGIARAVPTDSLLAAAGAGASDHAAHGRHE